MDFVKGRRIVPHHALRFLAAIALLCTTSVFASMTTTALTGRVVIGGTPGAGVTVTVTSPALQGSRTTTTDARGRYWIDTLPPGVYDVTFSKSGHTELTRRAVLELARVARADGTLEASEDEESVTSTVTTLTVAETTPVTAHVSYDGLHRMPIAATPAGAASIFAAVPEGSITSVDGVSVPDLADVGEEVTDQVTVIYAGAGAEVERSSGGVIAARIRTGSEESSLSVRDTLSNDSGLLHLFEAAAGGRILPDKLWFFAAGWRGDDAWRRVDDLRGVAVKLTAQPGAAHTIEGSYLDSDAHRASPSGLTVSSIRYAGFFGPTTSLDAQASRTSIPRLETGPAASIDRTALSLRGSQVLRGNVLSAGATLGDEQSDDSHAVFVNDRVSAGRWIVNAGVRQEHDSDGDHTARRLAASYDLLGDGRRAVFATWGEYGGKDSSRNRIASVGFASAIGTTGSARVDVIRRETPFASSSDEVRLAAQYRLFDRFEAGGTYAYLDDGDDAASSLAPKHAGTAWVSLELPLAEHEIGMTLLQHVVNDGDATSAPTDVALRYTLPVSHGHLTLASDITNVLGVTAVDAARALRFWIRARL